ncbi:hypothetical protein [Virgisporangium aurantiacum]|uniref:Uncharacterized protein n=1 Tax=Virgisporangium aurantiacum TaxID=175570 RepID=A0A8J3YY19_9ACTN|nr:hypothetical protein [Virgisporangium aurantiacum]GIJ53821.1 hypothetical protein Vau01_013370 [Virgisporangium aurantiacum]
MFNPRTALNAIGDRMLAKLLPATTASAAICPGRNIGQSGSCLYFCYQSSSGDHTTKYRWCSNDRRCAVQCYDCC